MADQPRYPHECPYCKFLGQHGVHDFYVCPGNKDATITIVHSDAVGDCSYSTVGWAEGPLFSLAIEMAHSQDLLGYENLATDKLDPTNVFEEQERMYPIPSQPQPQQQTPIEHQ